MKNFERITFAKDAVGAPKGSIFLSVTSETDRILTGWEVNKDGDDVSGATWDRRKRIITKDCITKRVEYVLDKMFATLVKKGTETR